MDLLEHNMQNGVYSVQVYLDKCLENAIINKPSYYDMNSQLPPDEEMQEEDADEVEPNGSDEVEPNRSEDNEQSQPEEPYYSDEFDNFLDLEPCELETYRPNLNPDVSSSEPIVDTSLNTHQNEKRFKPVFDKRLVTLRQNQKLHSVLKNRKSNYKRKMKRLNKK